MRKLFLFLSMGVLSLCIQTIFANEALAYENEVRQSGSSYIWRINNVDQGSTGSLATAINNCIGTGNRVVHVLAGGTLSSQINLQPGLRLYCHNVTFNKNHSGYGFYRDGSGDIRIYDMILNNNTNMGIRMSRASDILIQNVRIFGGSIGIRIDSHPSRPYEAGRWVYNVHLQDCRVENGSSHGFETYAVDGFRGYGLTARNMGECGVLLNQTHNGTLGTVNVYNCAWGTGYAGLRYANGCNNVTTEKLIADRCGRGFFIVQSGPSVNCHLNNAEIRECSSIGIWIENGTNCSVKAGCSESGVSVSGSGSYANVSNSCSTSGGGGSGTSYYQIKNRGTGLFLDGMGLTSNGSAVAQYANTTHVNSQWQLVSAGGSYYYLVNRGTGLKLDGYGRTANGSEVAQYNASTTHVNAQWTVQQYSGNYYRLQNRGTGLFIDGMGRTANGSAAGQWANTTHANAQWEMILVSGSGVLDSKDKEELSVFEAQNELKVFPNPASNVLNISLPAESENGATVKFLDAAGKVVLKTSVSGTAHELNIESLNAGFYILLVDDGINVFKEKIVVE